MMLACASPIGSATLWRRSIWAAWCEMNSIFSSPQQGLEVGLGDVGLDEAGGLGEALAPARGKVVDDHDPVSVGQVPLGHVRADEARASRDEDVHRILSMKRKAA